MNKIKRNLLILSGVISLVLGFFWSIPAFLQNRIGVATATAFLIIIGLILISISFGDIENDNKKEHLGSEI